MKNTRDIWNCIIWHQGKSWGDSFQPDKSAARDYFSFSELPPLYTQRASRRASYMSLHQSGSPQLGDSIRPCPCQPVGLPKLFPVAFPYKWPVLTHASDRAKVSQQISLSKQPQASLCRVSHYKWPRPSTSSNQPWFTAWPCLGTSKPSTNSSHLQIAL